MAVNKPCSIRTIDNLCPSYITKGNNIRFAGTMDCVSIVSSIYCHLSDGDDMEGKDTSERN